MINTMLNPAAEALRTVSAAACLRFFSDIYNRRVQQAPVFSWLVFKVGLYMYHDDDSGQAAKKKPSKFLQQRFNKENQ